MSRLSRCPFGMHLNAAVNNDRDEAVMQGEARLIRRIYKLSAERQLFRPRLCQGGWIIPGFVFLQTYRSSYTTYSIIGNT